MKKIIMGIALSVAAIANAAMPLSASATVNNNAGSIVKISNTCTDMAAVASNNQGSIVQIDGGGQCDINDILKGASVENNAGSYIKISNVCGDVSGIANNNAGSIIEIESTGACNTSVPTSVVVEPTPTVTELPQTGIGLLSLVAVMAIAGVAYLATYFLNGSRVAKIA